MHFRSKSLDSEFKTHLIVALTGTAMADSVCAFLDSDLSDPLCDYRTCKGSTEHISVLIDSACLNSRENIILNEFFLKILDVEL